MTEWLFSADQQRLVGLTGQRCIGNSSHLKANASAGLPTQKTFSGKRKLTGAVKAMHGPLYVKTNKDDAPQQKNINDIGTSAAGCKTRKVGQFERLSAA